MKHWVLSNLVLMLWLVAGCTSGFCQQKRPAPMGAMVTSDMFRTADSVHYVLKHNRTPPNGYYTIYEVTKFKAPPDPTNDTSSPPLYAVHDRHSIGAFSKGLRTGLWRFYTGDQKVREEVYKQGRRVSKQKCPCKN